MHIDVWADLVCPWCFIGKTRLQRAIAEAGMNDITITHRAFQLNPHASTHSEPTVDHLAAKYDVTREQALDMMSDVTEVAATEDLDYHLDRTMTGNTKDVHRFVLWVQQVTPDSTQPLLTDLYSAYFEKGERIFTFDDLEPYGQRYDLDIDAMRTMLAGRDFIDVVAADQATAREIGANGVPFFVFNNRLGLSGAQPFEVFQQALAQANAPD